MAQKMHKYTRSMEI